MGWENGAGEKAQRGFSKTVEGLVELGEAIEESGLPLRIELERKARRQAVAELTAPVEQGGKGLSNRQAAKQLGVSEKTVRNDKAPADKSAPASEIVNNGSPSELDPADKSAPAPKSGPTITLYTHKREPVEYPEPKGKSTFNATPGEGISWAAWSWNPVTGCEHGCPYCYAREIATSARAAATYPVGFTPLFHRERLDAPANTSVPRSGDPAKRRVFVCSMADLYGRWVPKKWVDQVHASEIENPQWTYIHLTKFPKRYLDVALPPTGWIGASVDEQKRVKVTEETFARIEGVAVKWVSLEPLLGPLEFTDLSMFDWVVIGAQTETRQPAGVIPASQPKFWEWVVPIVAAAKAAGCKVHMKPNLLGRVHPQSPGMELLNEYPEAA